MDKKLNRLTDDAIVNMEEIQVYITLEVDELLKMGFRNNPTKEEVTNRLHEILNENIK